MSSRIKLNYKHMKKRKELVTTSLGFVLIVTLLSACGGGSRQGAGERLSPNDTIEIADKETVVKEVIEYPLPSSFEITKMLNDAGAAYILSLSNPIKNLETYFTQQKKALNLGVYGADLSYASTYNQSQETMQYLKASKELVDELNIRTSFNEDMVRRIEANINNGDSLIKIISDSFYDTYKFLIKNDRDKLSLLVMTGSWIEGLYISTQVASMARDKEQIVHAISVQKSSLNKLIDLIYMKMEGSKMSDSTLDELTRQVEIIRNEITG